MICTDEKNESKILPEIYNYAVGAALLILTLATYLLAMLDLGAWNLIVALLIAAIKASLVALYFMHVRRSPNLTRGDWRRFAVARRFDNSDAQRLFDERRGNGN